MPTQWHATPISCSPKIWNNLFLSLPSKHNFGAQYIESERTDASHCFTSLTNAFKVAQRVMHAMEVFWLLPNSKCSLVRLTDSELKVPPQGDVTSVITNSNTLAQGVIHTIWISSLSKIWIHLVCVHFFCAKSTQVN